MKNVRQFANTAGAAGISKPLRTVPRPDGEIDGDRAAGLGGASMLRETVRETEPLGAFDAVAIRDLYLAAPTNPKGLRRRIRRSELRQIVPLADSTIYELERRGDFPQRFFLTARCVVWDLDEVLTWLQSRRQSTTNAVKKAPMPDYRQRVRRHPG